MTFLTPLAVARQRLTGFTKHLTAFAMLLMTAFLVAGCATAKIGLSQQDIASLKIVGVDVRFAPDMKFWWGNAEREYAKKHGVSEAAIKKAQSDGVKSDEEAERDAYQKLVESPGSKKYQRQKLAGMVKQTLSQKVLPQFHGTRAARLVVTIKQFRIPSAAQRLLVGGAPILSAKTLLQDARTGKPIGAMEKSHVARAGGGVGGVIAEQFMGDLEARVVKAYADDILSWMKIKTGNGIF